MEIIDELFEKSKSEMPECGVTTQDILKKAESEKRKRRIWIPLVAFPATILVACSIILPLTIHPSPDNENIQALPSGVIGNSDPIAIQQTWYVGLKTTSLPGKEKKVEVYYGYYGAMDMDEYLANPYYKIDPEQEVLLSIKREIYQTTESVTSLVESKIIASFDSTLGEAMQTRTFWGIPYTVNEDGSYGFGRYEREPVEDILSESDLYGAKEGVISYSFGIEPKNDATLDYYDLSDSGMTDPESFGFYYDTELCFEIGNKGEISLSLVDSFRPGVIY